MTSSTPVAVPVAVPLWRRVIVYGVVAVFAVWCVVGFWRDIRQIDLTPLAQGWHAVLWATLLSLFNYALRIQRWDMYLRTLGHVMPKRFVGLSFMAGFAFTLSPGKLGEMMRARYYLPRGVPVSAVTGAFFVERLLDLLAMILLAVVVLAELERYRFFLWVAVFLVVGLLACVALVPWPAVAQWLSRRPHKRLGHAGQSVVSMFVSARSFLSPGMLTIGLLMGLVAWGAEAVGLQLVAEVISPQHLSLPAAMGVYAIAIIVGALSFLPGGLGSTEAVMIALLAAHGFDMPQAILLTLVCRLLTLWLAVLIGWVCVWMLRGER